MGNREQVLDKIARNLDQIGVAASRADSEVVAEGLIISYVDADIQKPMGGVDGDVSPFLGIGVGAPGVIKIKGAATENTLAAIWTSEARMKVLRMVAGHANDIIVEADNGDELARMPGHADVLGVGM